MTYCFRDVDRMFGKPNRRIIGKTVMIESMDEKCAMNGWRERRVVSESE